MKLEEVEGPVTRSLYLVVQHTTDDSRADYQSTSGAHFSSRPTVLSRIISPWYSWISSVSSTPTRSLFHLSSTTQHPVQRHESNISANQYFIRDSPVQEDPYVIQTKERTMASSRLLGQEMKALLGRFGETVLAGELEDVDDAHELGCVLSRQLLRKPIASGGQDAIN